MVIPQCGREPPPWTGPLFDWDSFAKHINTDNSSILTTGVAKYFSSEQVTNHYNMAPYGGGSVLIVHHRDLSDPFGTKAPYSLANEMSEDTAVHVVCRKLAGKQATSEQNAVVHAISTGGVPILSTLLFHVLATLYAPLVAIRYRIDVVYTFQLSIVQGWLTARLSRSKFVIHLDSVPVRQRRDFTSSRQSGANTRDIVVRGLIYPYFKLARVLLGRSEVITLTEGIARKTEEVYDIDLSESEAIGMGVDVEKFSRDASLAKASKTWTMTYIGTIAEVRNLEQVIEAIAEVEYDVHFQLAGSGPQRDIDAIFTKAEQLGVDGNVTWLGMLPHEEIPDILAETDITVSPLPGIESFQISFPAKILEYMAAETVVIATDIDPQRRLIDDGESGFLYDGSLEDLVATIDRCIETEESHPEIKRSARVIAEDYDWELVVDRYEDYIFGFSDRLTSKPDHQPRITR